MVPSNKTKHPKPQFHVRNKAKNRIDSLSYNFFRNGTMQLKCTWSYLQKCRFSGTIKPNPDLLEPKDFKSIGYRNRNVRNGYKIKGKSYCVSCMKWEKNFKEKFKNRIFLTENFPTKNLKKKELSIKTNYLTKTI